MNPARHQASPARQQASPGPTPLAGSFRDPAGQVYQLGDRILRSVSPQAADDYDHVARTGLLPRLAAAGKVVAAVEVDKSLLGAVGMQAHAVLEHPRLPFISYPYEWSFNGLKSAALFHLDLQLECLEHDIALSDASAYNVQFLGSEPVFIDHLSFRRYRDGEFWSGHRQFCEQFLNPLLLRALFGLQHNAWYRGSQEGIATAEIGRILRPRHLLSWNVLTHVALPARLQAAARQGAPKAVQEKMAKRALPRAAFRAMLQQLRRWIAGLNPADKSASVWGNYSEDHQYGDADEAAKRAFVGAFATEVRPGLLWDLGCNSGNYAVLALHKGAGRVIGFDSDPHALETAFTRAQAAGLAFTPLYLDAANPSPDQGWESSERPGLAARASADAVLALALVHHLAIGRNLPLSRVVAWLISLAPRGVIEFVDKADPQVQRLLALREDIFPDYTAEAFLAAVSGEAEVCKTEHLQSGQRLLVWYERRQGASAGLASLSQRVV